MGEVKKAVAAKLINTLAEIGTAEVKKAGVFTLPGLCRIKTRMKPATKAGKREIRQDDHREGQAGQEGCQGVPGCGPQGQHLSVSGGAEVVVRLPVQRGSTHGMGSALALAPAGGDSLCTSR